MLFRSTCCCSCLFAIHVRVELRNGGQIGRDRGRDLRRFESAPRKPNRFFVRKFGIVVARAVLHDHGDAAGGADARNGGRREQKARPSLTPASLRCTLPWMASICSSRDLRSSHGLSETKKNAVLVLWVWRQQAEAVDADHACDAGRVQQGVGDLLRGRIGALQRGGIRQLQSDEHVALVFLRDEAGRQPAAQEDGEHRDDRKHEHRESGLVHQHAGGRRRSRLWCGRRSG